MLDKTQKIYRNTQVRYIRLKHYARLSGYTENALRCKIKKGVWIEGKHFFRAPDRTIFIDVHAIDDWITGSY